MAKTKGDLVLKALRKAGLYSNATLTDADPQAIEDAINDLEDMMAAWQAKGIELGYQFADTENGIMPLPDDDSGTRVGHLDDAYMSNGKPVGITLYQLPRSKYEELINVST